MKTDLLRLLVTQADETPVQLLRQPDPSRTNCYMWVHRTGELFREKPIIQYEYQKSRHHDHTLDFYRGCKGVLLSDALQQYQLVAQKEEGITSVNCFAHVRRDFADASKAIGKSNGGALKSSVVHQALELIADICHEENKFKDLSAEERLKQRQEHVKSRVESFFSWVRGQLSSGKVLPKRKTAEGPNYCLDHEKQLKVFLTDGNVPIDNSASERAIGPFTIGKLDVHRLRKGAEASALTYSMAETAEANNLKPYEYFKHLLTEMSNRLDKNGNVAPEAIDDPLPWAGKLPEACYKRR